MRVLWFVIISGIVLTAMYTFIGMRMIAPLQLQTPWKTTAWVVLFLCPLFHVLSFSLFLLEVRGSWTEPLQWANYLLLGLFSLVLAMVFAREVAWLAILLLDVFVDFVSSASLKLLPVARDARMVLFNISSLAILALAVLGVIIGFFEARKPPRVMNIDVPVKNLHPDLEGFRILQISDIHIGPTIRRPFVQRIIDLAKQQNADLIAVTGDLVDGSVNELRDDVEPFMQLDAPYGMYFVTGNHEHYSGVDQWMVEVRRLGMVTLNNEHRLLLVKSARLLIAGVPDLNADSMMKSAHSNPAKAMADAPPHDLSILLAHQPRSLFEAKAVDFDLLLSGHTHGGQFIPWNFVVPLQQPITAGLASVEGKTKKMWVYVTRGAGYWGPPLRLGILAEISVLRLVRR